MQVGLFLVSAQWPGRSHGAALAETVRLAVLADRLGLDDVWIAEHHFSPYGVCPSAITLAGHLLGATTRIGVGTAVSVLPATHPVALAEQAAMLELLSPGRLTLGVGRGGPWRELAVLGDTARRLERFEHGLGEELDVLLRALRSPTVGGEGPLLPFDEVPVVPRPDVPGRPPVLVAATSSGTVGSAARRGLPLLLGMHVDDAEKAATLRSWAEQTDLPGEVDPGHVGVGVAHVAETRAGARAAVREELPRWLAPGLAGYVRADGAPRTPRDVGAYADLLCRLHPVGTADDVADRLVASAAATGLRRMALLVQTTDDPGRTTETVTALAEVLPSVRARVAGAQQSRSSGDWLSSCPRGETKAR